MSKLKAHLIASFSILSIFATLFGIVYMPDVVGWCLLAFVVILVYGAIYGMLTGQGVDEDYRGW